MQVFSFGGGVQSTAALVLAAQGVLQVDAFLFCNVGDDSENPDTLRYVREVAMPYAKQHGIDLIELRRYRSHKAGDVLAAAMLGSVLDGDQQPRQVETLYERLSAKRPRVNIPMRLPSGAPAKRQCTSDFKIAVVNRWLREHGARANRPAEVMLGITTDEETRARRREHQTTPRYLYNSYPFLAETRRMSRQDCINTIILAGLPVPPKSACWFCPWHSITAWRDLREQKPWLFARAAGMEENINAWRDSRGMQPIWLTDYRKPLAIAVKGEQPSLFEDDDVCESGYCMV